MIIDTYLQNTQEKHEKLGPLKMSVARAGNKGPWSKVGWVSATRRGKWTETKKTARQKDNFAHGCAAYKPAYAGIRILEFQIRHSCDASMG